MQHFGGGGGGGGVSSEERVPPPPSPSLGFTGSFAHTCLALVPFS